MSRWSVVEKVLAGVAVLVFVGVAVLGVVALTSGDDVPAGCEVARNDSDIEFDASPSDVLRVFVQERSDEFPLDDSWTVDSVDGDLFVFVSDTNAGYYEVDVRGGMVRRYMVCPDGL